MLHLGVKSKNRSLVKRGSVAAVDTGAATLEGALDKKGGLRGWQPRHFMLKGSYLMYKIHTGDKGYAGGLHVFGPRCTVELVHKTTLLVKGFDEDDAPDAAQRKIKSMTLRAHKKSGGPAIDKWYDAIRAAHLSSKGDRTAAHAARSPRHGVARAPTPVGSAAIGDFREQFQRVAHDHGAIDREELAELLGSFDHAAAGQVDAGIRALGLESVTSFSFEQSFALHQRIAFLIRCKAVEHEYPRVSG